MYISGHKPDPVKLTIDFRPPAEDSLTEEQIARST